VDRPIRRAILRQHPIDADLEAQTSKVLEQKLLTKIANVADVLFFQVCLPF
jgi:hypothetical protein